MEKKAVAVSGCTHQPRGIWLVEVLAALIRRRIHPIRYLFSLF